MSNATRPPASKVQEGGLMGFLGFLAAWVAPMAEEASSTPGLGAVTTAGITGGGAVLLSWIRDRLSQ